MEKKHALGALAALSQETRLDIFRFLVQAGPEGIQAGGIGGALEVPSATLSFHLKELRNAGLVTARKVGRLVVYAADYGAMNRLLAYLTENCCRGSSMPAADQAAQRVVQAAPPSAPAGRGA